MRVILQNPLCLVQESERPNLDTTFNWYTSKFKVFGHPTQFPIRKLTETTINVGYWLLCKGLLALVVSLHISILYDEKSVALQTINTRLHVIEHSDKFEAVYQAHLVCLSGEGRKVRPQGIAQWSLSPLITTHCPN